MSWRGPRRGQQPHVQNESFQEELWGQLRAKCIAKSSFTPPYSFYPAICQDTRTNLVLRLVPLFLRLFRQSKLRDVPHSLWRINAMVPGHFRCSVPCPRDDPSPMRNRWHRHVFLTTKRLPAVERQKFRIKHKVQMRSRTRFQLTNVGH